MKLTVHLHTILQRQLPEGRVDQLQIDLPEGSLLADLLEYLEIALQPEDLLLVVNGRTAQPDQILVDGDHVNLIPAISGG
jgi:sulfur carrier protein ThiS